MSIFKDSIAFPTEPINEQSSSRFQTKFFLWRLAIGFAGLLATVITVTTTKRMLFHGLLNDGSVLFESRANMTWATETSVVIAIILLLIWSVGLFLSSYVACRRPVEMYPMVIALCGLIVAGWVIPSLFIHGGVAGPTTAIRIIQIVPLIACGAFVAQSRTIQGKTSDQKKPASTAT